MRRKTTSYRVGFEDLETDVGQMIKDNNSAILIMKDSVKEMQKEILDFKRYVELKASSRDLTFQTEVRECLTQQLTYINEI
jgi:hypothetical protein